MSRTKRPPKAFWPRTGRSRVPRLEVAELEARTVVGKAGHSDPSRLAHDLGIAVRFCTLEAAAGGLEAALIPDFAQPFEILCDPWVPTGARWDQTTDRRIAHELAHTLFYDWGMTPPRHLRLASREEEAFCDTFAETLIATEPTISHGYPQADGGYPQSLRLLNASDVCFADSMASAVCVSSPVARTEAAL